MLTLVQSLIIKPAFEQCSHFKGHNHIMMVVSWLNVHTHLATEAVQEETGQIAMKYIFSTMRFLVFKDVRDFED